MIKPTPQCYHLKHKYLNMAPEWNAHESGLTTSPCDRKETGFRQTIACTVAPIAYMLIPLLIVKPTRNIKLKNHQLPTQEKLNLMCFLSCNNSAHFSIICNSKRSIFHGFSYSQVNWWKTAAGKALSTMASRYLECEQIAPYTIFH